MFTETQVADASTQNCNGRTQYDVQGMLLDFSRAVYVFIGASNRVKLKRYKRNLTRALGSEPINMLTIAAPAISPAPCIIF